MAVRKSPYFISVIPIFMGVIDISIAKGILFCQVKKMEKQKNIYLQKI